MREFLIVYYSRSGKTAMAARMLAEMLGADIEEIREQRSFTGCVGWAKALICALKKEGARLVSTHSQAGDRTLILGMPVWAASVPPAVLEYLRTVQVSKPMYAFCTLDGSGSKGLFKKLRALAPNLSSNTLAIIKPAKDVERLRKTLLAWADAIRSSAGRGA
ncbi:MAG: hypothetical protein GXY38_06690 [Planctomycetes bacterium]|nr:hypothetical protein [Planctomycetota bacterium]